MVLNASGSVKSIPPSEMVNCQPCTPSVLLVIVAFINDEIVGVSELLTAETTVSLELLMQISRGASVLLINKAVNPFIGFLVSILPVGHTPSASLAQPIIAALLSASCTILRIPLLFVFGIIAPQFCETPFTCVS